MDGQDAVRLTDELVFKKTGEHLDNLQAAIVRGTLHGQKYAEIAAGVHCTEGHIKDVASILWKMLSRVLGENVKKSNFRATLDRTHFSHFSHPKSDRPREDVSISSEFPPPTAATPTRLDLDDVPDADPFYGRGEELDTLETWIVKERCRVAMVLGMAGMGKTSLSAKLVDRIQSHFDGVIWRSLFFSPTPENLLADLLQFLDDRPDPTLPDRFEGQLSELMKCLRSRRYLIVLDDVQGLFASGEFAGHYLPDYENYQILFRHLAAFNHDSCLLLNGWEPPVEIAEAIADNIPVHFLQLDGLGKSAIALLEHLGLCDRDSWDTLIDIYRGNPLWLKGVAAMIRDLFGGRVSEFLRYDDLCLSDDAIASLDRQFYRLSNLERQVVLCLALKQQLATLSQLQEQIETCPDLLGIALQSLGRRSWLETPAENARSHFRIQPIVKQYIDVKYPVGNTHSEPPAIPDILQLLSLNKN